jgi:hypothetical protein
MTGEALGRLVGLILFPFLVMAIVGGLYYLAVRPRLTFLQAMFRWWVILVGVLLLVLGVCGQLVANT